MTPSDRRSFGKSFAFLAAIAAVGSGTLQSLASPRARTLDEALVAIGPRGVVRLFDDFLDTHVEDGWWRGRHSFRASAVVAAAFDAGIGGASDLRRAFTFERVFETSGDPTADPFARRGCQFVLESLPGYRDVDGIRQRGTVLDQFGWTAMTFGAMLARLERDGDAIAADVLALDVDWRASDA